MNDGEEVTPRTGVTDDFLIRVIDDPNGVPNSRAIPATDLLDASAISVADAGGYYTGTTVESVLAELPSRFGSSATGKVMEIPTYDYNLDVTHFSVVDYGPGNTWNGYRYWMAFTPYPDATRENPSILRSSDGLTWAVPAGVINPVWSAADAVSAGYAYNSDTHLIDLDGTTQVMYFRTGTAGTKNAIWVTTSSDGWATKSTPAIVLSDGANESTLLSPAVVHDGTNYRMYVCDFTTGSVNYYTSATATGAFATKVACTVPSWLTGKMWHLDMQKKGSTYYMLANSNETTSAGSNLYVLTSTDGVTFTRSDVYPDVYPNDYGFARHYRSALVVRADGAYDIYASALDSSQTTWRGVAYQGIVNGRAFTAQQSVDDISAATRSMNSFFPGAPHSWTVSDNFQRADAVTLGTTTSGTAWSMLTGTAGISSGNAYAITNMRAVVESSLSDVEIRCDITGSAMSEFYVILRATDASNWWRIGTDGVSGRLRVEKFVTASLTTVTSLTSPAWRIGDQLKVRATGSTIYVYRNNVLSTTVTDSFNSTATKHGIGGLAGNVRFANWGVKAYS